MYVVSLIYNICEALQTIVMLINDKTEKEDYITTSLMEYQ